MTPKKQLEDLLAEYTEDLLAERRPRLSEAATLDDDERSHLMAMLVLLRRLKAVHQEVPAPREDFLERLDSFVCEEIARQVAPESQPTQTPAASPEDARSVATIRPLLRHILEAGRDLLRRVAAPEVGGRWRLAGVAVLILVLGLQVQLYLHVRRLERQNQALVARLERLSPVGGLVPLGQPLGQQTAREKEAAAAGPRSLDDLFAGVELRLRVEQRIRELEREAETKTGGDRQIAEALLRELRAFLRPSQRP